MPGSINPPAANKHGYWTNDQQPADAKAWLETATRHEGSWWPWWTKWLGRQGQRQDGRRRAAQGPDRACAGPLRDDAVMDMP